MITMQDISHRRWNPLLEQWLLVSPHRARRPWSGRVEDAAIKPRPSYDPGCYLCPGNERAGGIRNPEYESTFVFDNDFAALLSGIEMPQPKMECSGLVRQAPEQGVCRVICFSPRHDLTVAEMQADEIRKVIDLWTEQLLDLESKDFIQAVTIFENKGEIMGCSNPHPHGQIWANASIPLYLEKEIQSQGKHQEKHGRPMLEQYLEWELDRQERILVEGDLFVALVPHWAVWPFEAMILPRRPVARMDQLDDLERNDWAGVIKGLLVRYDNLFQCSFPYSMGIHQAPAGVE